MVPADDDGRLELTALHHLVEREPEAVPVAQAHPADPRGQSLEMDALACHVEPVVQVRIVGYELAHLLISAGDVLRIAR